VVGLSERLQHELTGLECKDQLQTLVQVVQHLVAQLVFIRRHVLEQILEEAKVVVHVESHRFGVVLDQDD
jgi:hypothetical protein